MSKQADIKLLEVPKDASGASIMDVLKEALAFARKHNVKSAFIVLVPSNIKQDDFMKSCAPATAEELDELLEAIEDGHQALHSLIGS